MSNKIWLLLTVTVQENKPYSIKYIYTRIYIIIIVKMKNQNYIGLNLKAKS